MAVDALGIVGKLATPIEYALNYWSRRSEFSADRAALVYCGEHQTMTNALLRLTGGPEKLTGKINLQEYAKQAEHYYQLRENSKWHKLLQGVAVLNQDHPYSAVRISELMKWSKSRDFQMLHEAVLKYETQVKCASCGRYNEKRNKFCRYCGKPMTGSAE
jgi:Zn-dependent protease with chaperone function